MSDGDRIYSTVVAEFQGSESDLDQRRSLYAMLARSAERFEVARQEAEGSREDQPGPRCGSARKRTSCGPVRLEDGTGLWYQRNDEEHPARGGELIDQLALPDIPGDQRVSLEELGTRIDRARRRGRSSNALPRAPVSHRRRTLGVCLLLVSVSWWGDSILPATGYEAFRFAMFGFTGGLLGILCRSRSPAGGSSGARRAGWERSCWSTGPPEPR